MILFVADMDFRDALDKIKKIICSSFVHPWKDKVLALLMFRHGYTERLMG